jgi:hypothetical protein
MDEHLEALVRLLRENGEPKWAVIVEDAMTGSQAGLDAFLASNELWGGSGSIADGAGGGQCSEGRRRIARILIQLGKEQMRTGNLNPRTEMWVTAFSKWEEAGI